MSDLITPDQLMPNPREFVLSNGVPDTIAEWRALAESLLTNQSCVFQRNVEISSRYAWIYKFLPAYFKWAGMAAFASHHIRLAFFPFRLDKDRTGYVDIPRSLGRQKALLIGDVDVIRMTNNGIFNDIFWAHLAYATAEDGIEYLRVLLGADQHYAAVLAGFETIDQGRRSLEKGTVSEEDRRTAMDLIWQGNVQLLEHEQRALVQPNFDRLSGSFARLFSMGSALNFEARGVRQELAYFTSFYVHTLVREMPQVHRARAWPKITLFDERWPWIVSSIVPRFRKFETHVYLVDTRLNRIFDQARDYASNPCILPRSPQPEEPMLPRSIGIDGARVSPLANQRSQ